ncbi:MAG: hypothetical protein QNI89_02350 [Desulfobacterales bacterium]|nr:hypothetical protein [Desulfobacterales bacterium]
MLVSFSRFDPFPFIRRPVKKKPRENSRGLPSDKNPEWFLVVHPGLDWRVLQISRMDASKAKIEAPVNKQKAGRRN